MNTTTNTEFYFKRHMGGNITIEMLSPPEQWIIDVFGDKPDEHLRLPREDFILGVRV